MKEKLSKEVREILNRRFSRDSLCALATEADHVPSVRAVNAYYEEGSFYVVTHARSEKMKQIAKNPTVAVCGDWFTAHGTAEDLGSVGAASNAALADTLRKVFSAWWNNGHMDESDPDTHILCIRLTDGVLFSHGTRYEIDFTET